MIEIKKNTVVRNSQIILNTSALSDNTEVEVLISPIDISEKHSFTIENRQERNEAIVKLFHEWREDGDKDEQQETWEFLRHSLDEDRLSDRKFFV